MPALKNPEALEHCAIEPIHLLERVQHYGAMGVFDAATGRALARTPNFAALLGDPAHEGAGAPALPMSLHEVLQRTTDPMRPRVALLTHDSGEPRDTPLYSATGVGPGTSIVSAVPHSELSHRFTLAQLYALVP